jgi:menaquinol-cytochrome c reductase cytochrome b/c subunit
MRCWASAFAPAAVLGGCGTASTSPPSATTARIIVTTTGTTPGAIIVVPAGGPSAIELEPPQAVKRAGGSRLAEFNRGRSVMAQSGCLACHKVGDNGNAGPGPNPTYVGARLSAPLIERALVHATESMPSFNRLPKAKLHALVVFLSLLRK